MGEEKRFCRKCFLEEADPGMYETVRHELARLKPSDRAEDDVYSARLSVCGECDRLNGGTCMSCGCYVELRAANKRARCPMNRW